MQFGYLRDIVFEERTNCAHFFTHRIPGMIKQSLWSTEKGGIPVPTTVFRKTFRSDLPFDAALFVTHFGMEPFTILRVRI
jgi:hypothetical protein